MAEIVRGVVTPIIGANILGGRGIFSRRAVGREYAAGVITGAGATTLTLVANRIHAFPFDCPEAISVDQMIIEVTTGAAGLARIGIYADNGSLYPGTLVVDAGAVDTTAAAFLTAVISQALSEGTLYWFALLANATPTVRAMQPYCCWDILGFVSAAAQTGHGWFHAQTYGALPATFPSASPGVWTNSSGIPIIRVRRSA